MTKNNKISTLLCTSVISLSLMACDNVKEVNTATAAVKESKASEHNKESSGYSS